MAKSKEITKISDLIPDANNYNKGTEFGSGLIAKSIQKNGLGRSLLLDKHGKVIAGNKTLEGTVAAGFNDEDIIVVKTDGSKLVVVQRTDLDLDTRKGKEMALADNATAKANLAWDYDALGADFQSDELEAWGVFAEESFGGVPDNSLNGEAREDGFDVPEVETVKTDIVLGDLFEIGPHRLLCGDSTKVEDVERLMGGEKADMVFTDPPYGIDYDDSRWDAIQKKHTGGNSRKFGKIEGDSNPFDPSFLLSEFSYCKEIFIWGMQYYPQHLGRGGCIVWNRKTEEQKDVPYVDFELCWSKQERNKMAWITWGGFKNKEKGGERVHPTQKPVALPAWFFERWGSDNSLVADLFLGSGTTMVAAHQLNRKCYGMELSEKYCQVIVDRMLKLDPTLEVKKNGQPYNRMAP